MPVPAIDNRCQIYFNRPRICRDYTTDECEYDEVWSFDKAFETPEQIWEYAEALLPPRRNREVRPVPLGCRSWLALAKPHRRQLTSDQKGG